jgi:hypothetical protein
MSTGHEAGFGSKSIEHMFSNRLGTSINNLVNARDEVNISAPIATFSPTKWIWNLICFVRAIKGHKETTGGVGAYWFSQIKVVVQVSSSMQGSSLLDRSSSIYPLASSEIHSLRMAS